MAKRVRSTLGQLRGVLATGTECEVMIIAQRFTKLPRFFLDRELQVVKDTVLEVERLATLLGHARAKMRTAATYLLEQAERHWTTAEIHDATGY